MFSIQFTPYLSISTPTNVTTCVPASNFKTETKNPDTITLTQVIEPTTSLADYSVPPNVTTNSPSTQNMHDQPSVQGQQLALWSTQLIPTPIEGKQLNKD